MPSCIIWYNTDHVEYVMVLRVQGGDAHPAPGGEGAAHRGRHHTALLREARRRRHDGLQNHLHPGQKDWRYAPLGTAHKLNVQCMLIIPTYVIWAFAVRPKDI